MRQKPRDVTNDFVYETAALSRQRKVIYNTSCQGTAARSLELKPVHQQDATVYQLTRMAIHVLQINTIR